MISKSDIRFFNLVFLWFLAGLVPVQAQSFGDAFTGVGDNDEPVNIEAERLEVIDREKTAILTGNVRIIQGSTVVSGREMRVFYLRKGQKGQTKSGIERIEITGNVAIKSEKNEATANKATIDLIENSASLTGNVNLSQGDNIAQACSLWVDLETRKTRLNHTCDSRIVIIAAPQSGETE
ncbi:MAG: LptA/OstA family protein [Pseudomonadota bacterium]